MLEFGENFKAGEEHIMCPLCHLHFDNQDLVTECPEIRKKIKIESRISDLYKETVDVKTVIMLDLFKPVAPSAQKLILVLHVLYMISDVDVNIYTGFCWILLPLEWTGLILTKLDTLR